MYRDRELGNERFFGAIKCFPYRYGMLITELRACGCDRADAVSAEGLQTLDSECGICSYNMYLFLLRSGSADPGA
jgi:hypothetical protein